MLVQVALVILLAVAVVAEEAERRRLKVQLLGEVLQNSDTQAAQAVQPFQLAAAVAQE
jgi:hypothetical protein